MRLTVTHYFIISLVIAVAAALFISYVIHEDKTTYDPNDPNSYDTVYDDPAYRNLPRVGNVEVYTDGQGLKMTAVEIPH